MWSLNRLSSDNPRRLIGGLDSLDCRAAGAIVTVKPDRQLSGAMVGSRVCDGIGLFRERGLDEAFGLAVCRAWCGCA
ncbi:hypothetical protein MES5069_110108 [Mesorhizobium escarrei]|uniref:Uncharacterized protein n=1 Tax=Mesorhizobium escarrei TaxID=666018 RepID=A0ABM9DH46_9HYPH|nr:hypothetical protein MES5069_110108 [Mesorhizobium escarrei]